jgi:1,4-alpha-glucan branching enzyme
LLNEQDRSGSDIVSMVGEDRSVQLVSEQESEVWIRFVYFDENAESIAVAGDFSDWDPVNLSREIINDKIVWTGMIPVVRGEHSYMFVKDGEEWLTDPLADVQRDDGFGNKNAVLFI